MRDPTEYRRFIEATYHSKDREDPYTHFFLKEASMKEALTREYELENEREASIEDGTESARVLDEG